MEGDLAPPSSECSNMITDITVDPCSTRSSTKMYNTALSSSEDEQLTSKASRLTSTDSCSSDNLRKFPHLGSSQVVTGLTRQSFSSPLAFAPRGQYVPLEFETRQTIEIKLRSLSELLRKFQLNASLA